MWTTAYQLVQDFFHQQYSKVWYLFFRILFLEFCFVSSWQRHRFFEGLTYFFAPYLKVVGKGWVHEFRAHDAMWSSAYLGSTPTLRMPVTIQGLVRDSLVEHVIILSGDWNYPGLGGRSQCISSIFVWIGIWVISTFIEFNESLRTLRENRVKPLGFWEGSNDSYLDVLLVLSNWVISPLYK